MSGGATAVLYGDGKAVLQSFSMPRGGHNAILETIAREADGAINNRVVAVP